MLGVVVDPYLKKPAAVDRALGPSDPDVDVTPSNLKMDEASRRVAVGLMPEPDTIPVRRLIFRVIRCWFGGSIMTPDSVG